MLDGQIYFLYATSALMYVMYVFMYFTTNSTILTLFKDWEEDDKTPEEVAQGFRKRQVF